MMFCEPQNATAGCRHKEFFTRFRHSRRQEHDPEHDPEKWSPVFRKDHAPTKKLRGVAWSVAMSGARVGQIRFLCRRRRVAYSPPRCCSPGSRPRRSRAQSAAKFAAHEVVSRPHVYLMRGLLNIFSLGMDRTRRADREPTASMPAFIITPSPTWSSAKSCKSIAPATTAHICWSDIRSAPTR